MPRICDTTLDVEDMCFCSSLFLFFFILLLENPFHFVESPYRRRKIGPNRCRFHEVKIGFGLLTNRHYAGQYE